MHVYEVSPLLFCHIETSFEQQCRFMFIKLLFLYIYTTAYAIIIIHFQLEMLMIRNNFCRTLEDIFHIFINYLMDISVTGVLINFHYHLTAILFGPFARYIRCAKSKSFEFNYFLNCKFISRKLVCS